MTDGEGRFFVAPRPQISIKKLAPIWFAKEQAEKDWDAYRQLYGLPDSRRPKRYSGNSRDRRRHRRADLRKSSAL